MDEEGCVFIKWVDRTVSEVKPQELYKVDTEVMYCICNMFIGGKWWKASHSLVWKK